MTDTIVGGSILRSASSPFYTVTESVVPVNLDEKNGGDIYPLYQKRGDRYLFGLLRKLLDDLMIASGVQLTLTERFGDEESKFIFDWRVAGFRIHPDQFRQELKGSYRLDLSIPRAFDPDAEVQSGGARYLESFKTHYYNFLRGNQKRRHGAGAEAAHIFELESSLSQDKIVEARQKAHIAARTACISMMPHGMRRSETGALHAMLRNGLGISHAYTKEELKNGFTVYRAQFRDDALKDAPPEVQIAAWSAMTAQALDIPAEAMARMIEATTSASKPADLEPVEDGPMIVVGPDGEAEAQEPDAREEIEQPPEEATQGNGVATLRQSTDELIEKIKDVPNDDRPDGLLQKDAQALVKAAGIKLDFKFPLTAGQMRSIFVNG